jgi:hypothetical protein
LEDNQESFAVTVGCAVDGVSVRAITFISAAWTR